MVIFLRIVIVIFALQAAYPLFAADKPLWSMNIKPQGAQKDPFSYLQGLNNTDSFISIRFPNDDEIMIAFLRYESADKKKTETKVSNTTLVELLLHRETGKLIKHVEWPLEMKKPISEAIVRFQSESEILITYFRHELPDDKKINTEERPKTFVALLMRRETGEVINSVEWPVSVPVPVSAFSSLYRFYSFPANGYLVRINDSIHKLDSSLNIIHSKKLERQTRYNSYGIISSDSGYFFALGNREFNGTNIERSYEIIDWRTFEVIEKMNAPDFYIIDILNDRLLAVGLPEERDKWLLEKKIGDSSWINLGGDSGLENAQFVFNDAIIVQCSLKFSSLGNPSFWFVIERDGRRSPPVSYGINSQERIGTAMSFSERRPIIAFIAYNLPSFRDWGSTKKYWTDVWDVPTGQRLLRTKSEKDIYSILFPDGRSLVRLTEKKLEMYVVPDTPVKKK